MTTREIRCDVCSRAAPSYDIVSCGSIEHGYRQLCGKCFNAEVAQFVGLNAFGDPNFQPVVIANCNGVLHEFQFRTHRFGDGVAIDAFELRDGSPAGSQFQIIGDPHDDLLVLLGKLIERMRLSLSVKYLTNGSHGLQIDDHQVVKGRIEWDSALEGQVPLLIIDGGRLRGTSLGVFC
jgi:hypothetical protein